MTPFWSGVGISPSSDRPASGPRHFSHPRRCVEGHAFRLQAGDVVVAEGRGEVGHHRAPDPLPLMRGRRRNGIDVRRAQKRSLERLQPACRDDGVSDELLAEIREDVQAVGRKVGEEVPEILFLMCVDAETDDGRAGRLVELTCSERAKHHRPNYDVLRLRDSLS